MTATVEKIKKFLSVEQLAQRHPAFTASAIRHLIFSSRTNGFHKVIFRVGRKLVLEELAFEAWVSEQNSKGGK